MRTFELRVYKLRRNLNSFQGVVYGGIHDGSPECRCNYRRWIDGWK